VVPPMMVRYSSAFKFYWDILIIILALFISIVLPIEIAFNPPFLFTSAEIAIESIINLIFMIDIFINFRNTFVSSQSGDEVFS
jgi:CRP-like cAMP-binding protein